VAPSPSSQDRDSAERTTDLSTAGRRRKAHDRGGHSDQADPVAAAVRSLMAQRGEWTGTASDLLGALAATPGARDARSKAWPDSPRALSGRLRRAATFLRKTGIEISFDREGHARTRVIPITKAPERHPLTEAHPKTARRRSRLAGGQSLRES
jgi:hypothetical protein